MHTILIQYICLVFIILALVMVSNRLRVAYPIVLVLGGLALSLTNAFLNITVDPELIFFIFLPPLLYEAAWQTSWKEFWRWRRVITSFAFPIVILTSCVVAFASNAVIPGFTMALGFLLGGIVSPPDAISASTIIRQTNAPKRLISIIEGESLLNDASSLIVVRFALLAVITGQFHFGEAVGNFVLVIVMGTLIGVGIGLLFYAIYKWLPTTPSIEIVLSVLSPYCMYYAAEHFHFSGVLAVVSGALLLSNKRQQMLSYQGRVQGSNVWSTIGFVLNGFVFMLIGLQLPSILQDVETLTLWEAAGYGLAISIVLIVTRLLCTLGAAAFTLFIRRYITVADPNPGFGMPIIFGWAGMRGVVSLAAAFSIPVTLANGQAFPYRNLILFITFIVILVTLVFQGLTLPWVIRKINPTDRFTTITENKQELIIQKKIARVSVEFLETQYDGDLTENAHLSNMHARFKAELTFFENLSDLPASSESPLRHYQQITLLMLERQRAFLHELNKREEFDEDIIRKYLSLIDLEEFKLREKLIDLVVDGKEIATAV